jgi:Ca2+-binding RTX toxin-like protein
LRRALISLVAAALLLLIAASSATPEGRIVIRGAESGTHLQLSLSGSNLIVNGPMGDATEGCGFVRDQVEASCPLADAGSIEIDTGPANDKVTVLDRLPLPLTAYLGDGSDKLVGNAESDTCYPQGTPRNRCIGEGGNDICISAPINTDCVGGGGDDYCKTSNGSDGCWGGPGDDTCLMGGGEDGCHGEGGDDRLYGGPGGDQLYGGDGTDLCIGDPGRGKARECEFRPRRPRSPRSR